jgi:DNA adenine methylase
MLDAISLSDKGTVIRPLLKWAGGKRQLLPALRLHYPSAFTRYIEPFFGSGAVFFDLLNDGRLEGKRARLVDINGDLIGCYEVVRRETEAVITVLEGLERDHRRRGSACYYEARDRFNILRAQTRTYTPELAATLIYLNRTGFNGLFRVNRDGEFNVPAGRYANPLICDAGHVRAVAGALSTKGVSVECVGFEEALADAGDGDFVYCDPPYAPLTRTSNFAHYTAGGFSPLDQERLREAVIAASRRGATVLVSNSSAQEIEKAYSSTEAKQAGLRVQRVPARRAINARAWLRGPVAELIITNAIASGSSRRPQGTYAASPAGMASAFRRKKMAKAGLRPGYPDQLAAAGTRKRQSQV